MTRRGFALLAALWLLVAISGVALEISLAARDRRLAIANTIEGARARAAAVSALADLQARLDRALARSRSAQGTSDAILMRDPWHDAPVLLRDTVRLADARYAAVLRDADAYLNLDRATEAELRNLMTALHVDAGRADEIAQSIMDWRDADDLHRLDGAERVEYLRKGAPVLPPNGPFRTLAELRFVNGVTDDVYRRVRPYLTLLGSGQVNLNAAPEPVLRALPGMSEEAVAAIMDARQAGRPVESIEELSLRLSTSARRVLVDATPELLPQVVFQTREVEAVSTGWLDGSPVVGRATGLFVRGGSATFLVWERIDP
jgi:general secretion pathway protein K